MKKSRHNEILRLIERNSVETQEELAELLKSAGYSVTQATVSRDIRELKLTKAVGDNGKQIYVSFAKSRGEIPAVHRFIKDVVTSVDCAGNLLVVKTRTGLGMAVAVEIDGMEIDEMLGTIGSDDVVFCAVRTAGQAEELKTRFLSMIG